VSAIAFSLKSVDGGYSPAQCARVAGIVLHTIPAFSFLHLRLDKTEPLISISYMILLRELKTVPHDQGTFLSVPWWIRPWNDRRNVSCLPDFFCLQ
jgi:hypothetical protein